MIIGGPALTKYNDRALRNLTTAPASVTSSPGALVHIKTLTASSSANLSFVHGSSDVVLDSTYPIYKFEFINIHPATDNAHFQFNFRDGDTDYDAVKTTTAFESYQNEAGTSSALTYQATNDIAQGTGFQDIATDVGNGNDESCAGTLHLFNPSSTTFVKHFIATGNMYNGGDFTVNDYVAGYCNTTTAIDGVQFKCDSGNIDAGTIKLYGIKDA
tara:strand:- start:640 stop:1284 length:645 start_codon:yes stop_codon:yes gene_type:complete